MSFSDIIGESKAQSLAVYEVKEEKKEKEENTTDIDKIDIGFRVWGKFVVPEFYNTSYAGRVFYSFLVHYDAFERFQEELKSGPGVLREKALLECIRTEIMMCDWLAGPTTRGVFDSDVGSYWLDLGVKWMQICEKMGYA